MNTSGARRKAGNTETKKDEIARLSKAFDRMSGNLKKVTASRDELDMEIAERRRAEEELRKAGEYNRSLIEASLDPLVTIGPNGKITDVNAATESVTGRSRAELIGTDFSDYFTEPAKAKAGYKRVFREGTVRDYPLEIRHRDGRITPVLYNATVYKDEAGRVIGIFAAARDITERKKAEEALRLAGAYNRSLIEASLDPLVTIGPDGKITDVNAATESVTGRSRAELIGTDFSDYFTDTKRARAGYKKVFHEGSVHDYALEIRRLDGQVIPVLYNATVYRDEAGKVIGVFAAARDITRMKMAEEALRMHARQQAVVAGLGQLALVSVGFQALMDEAVAAVAKNLNVEYCKILELMPDGQALLLKSGVGWNDGLIGKATVGSGKDSQAGFTLAAGKPVVVEDLRKETRFTSPPLLKEHGVVSGASVVIKGVERPFGVLGAHTSARRAFSEEDVNFLQAVANVIAAAFERKMGEEEIRRLNAGLEKRVLERTAQLEAANKELESFSYSVSHDLRAPLRAMDGFSQALLEDYSGQFDERGGDYLKRIRAASQKMAQLIDDMLMLSRVTRSEMRLEAVNLSAIARKVSEELSAMNPQRHVEFAIKDGVMVDGDAMLLGTVIQNLIGNAWKFTSRHPRARIEFGVMEHKEGPAYYVKDDGAGFDMTYADKLFTPFQRLHDPAEFPGTGIGLVTVQRIIHRHGGRVWAEGEVDKGATFYFTV